MLLNIQRPAAAHDIVIFDVDGVLVDTSRSFYEVIVEALRWAWTVPLGRQNADSSFSKEHFTLTKTHPAFNDDYDIAWAAACCAAANDRESLAESLPSPEEWRSLLDGCSNMDVPSWVRRSFGEHVDRETVHRVCDELYFGAETRLEGRVLPTPRTGLQSNERPLISMHWNSLPVPSGIYTGRSRRELAPALERIGWQDFPPRMIITADLGITKPSPLGLSLLCEAAGASNPLFLGDTESDRKALRSFGRGVFALIGALLPDEPISFSSPEEALMHHRII
ncbi:MAG: HAD family hydrolase [Synergistota bacterium]|nr:HAD family hydrolase [Synergistota bacterium]